MGFPDGAWREVGLFRCIDDAREACKDWRYFVFSIEINFGIHFPRVIGKLPPISYPKALP